MQSSDYVPGVSGWKFLGGGAFEINAKSITVGGLNKAPERQVVSVEVCSYSKYDLPKDAANLLQFMQAELQKVPEEFRHAAEFEEFDTSYGDDSFNPRLFLSYSRLETEEELADRIEKSKVAGTCIKIADGVLTLTQDGVTRTQIGNLEKVELPESFIEDGTIANAKLGPEWQLKMASTPSGERYVAGIGLGLESQFLTSADKFAIKESSTLEKPITFGDVVKTLDLLAREIRETPLGKDLLSEINKPQAIADQVRDVIRAELRPGGMMWRR